MTVIIKVYLSAWHTIVGALTFSVLCVWEVGRTTERKKKSETWGISFFNELSFLEFEGVVVGGI